MIAAFGPEVGNLQRFGPGPKRILPGCIQWWRDGGEADQVMVVGR